MKMTMVWRLGDGAGELAQRLAHEAGLQAHVGVAHLAFDFGLGHERRHRVDDDDVDGAGAHQRLGDLERLLAGVGLGDEQVVGLDAELSGVAHVEGVLGVDEGGDAALLLGLGDRVQRQRGLAGRLRAVDLDDASPREAADAERDVEGDGARRDRLHVLHHRLLVAEAHDGALAEGLLDGGDRQLDRLFLLRCHGHLHRSLSGRAAPPRSSVRSFRRPAS